MAPDLPNFSKGNNPGKKGNSDSEPQNKIVWVESEDVYKPILKSISEFTEERGISDSHKKEVYIRTDALEDLKAHLRSNLRVEQGGILFGNAYSDPHYGIYVEITAAVAAPATIGTGAHLEFTSDSWLSIMNYARSEHPQENIVGWYHSHPNLSVFMSPTDRNTQQAFFHHPWCLSIVYDPVRLEIGYFLGEKAVPVYPGIFGQTRQQIQEPRVRHQDIQWREEREDNNDRQPQDNTDLINRAPEVTATKQARRFPVTAWMIFVLVIIAALCGSLLLNNLFNNSISNKPVSPLKADIKTMPAPVFSYLEKEKNLLRYPIVKVGDSIGKGTEITLLVISKEVTENAERFQLFVDEFIPNENVKDVEVIQVTDLIENSDKSLSDYNYRSPIKSEKTIELQNAQGGVIVPMFSSLIPTPVRTETQGARGRGNSRRVSPSPTSNNTEPAKKVVRDVVYIPRSIEYKDSNEKIQKIEIKEILKDG
ncbi:Mov34/MPN/PAD-1 family protein [Argonema antarcticum]|uniref:Mov34/MPN/PAD-1 family protein n=1 Tax=Argonema antarcticum TaxID=2942763 RepID=UPI00201394E6|nr:Mov34/MPN/PAD-1 family protein [Argonema antarcticum]MCL1471002.1 Mov34/MPN/PAD-1 family protein [Argonema antarcticum A004/B2]